MFIEIRITSSGQEGEGLYVGRPSPWGNPFIVPFNALKGPAREKALERYEEYLKKEPFLCEWLLKEIENNVLILDCHCLDLTLKSSKDVSYPFFCHAEILAKRVFHLLENSK